MVAVGFPGSGLGEQFNVFRSEEYGFVMKYPADWIKNERPEGNYYIVFEALAVMGNFRCRIHVAVHSPVGDTLAEMVQGLRKGISDLQDKAGVREGEEQLQILDEGGFKCNVQGAYFVYLRVYDTSLRSWMDTVIVFYKHKEILLRVSCLAPSHFMERQHRMFNEVLLSVTFGTQVGKIREGPARWRVPALGN
jgi:hypothetical protein